MSLLSAPPRTPLLIGPVVLGVAAGYLGTALHPTLAVEQPALLIALNPRIYHLALVAGEISLPLFLLVGLVRLVSTDPFAYLIGWHHGEAGRRWIRHQMEGTDGVVGAVDRWFPRVGPLIVLLAPNLFVSLLAGVTRMRPAVFFPLNVAGTIGRLLLVWWMASQVEDQLDAVLDFFSRYRTPATVVAIGLVAIQVLVSSRRGTGQVGGVRELEHELDAEDGTSAS